MDQYKEALEAFNNVYNLEVQQLGEHHQFTLATKHNIAQTLSEMGQYKEALEAFNKVYDLRVQQLG